MSEEQINATIAEACGWTYEPEEFPNYPWLDEEGEGHRRLPDYCADLNAMHEAEKRFLLSIARCELPLSKAENEANSYFRQLELVCDACDRAHPIHATARQRAEAFLRTIGKWEEAAK